MKININFKLKKNELPLDYRKGFISVIKKALETENKLLYKFYYNNKTQKPFTFSVYFPELQGKSTKKDINVGNKINLLFSSNNYDLITSVANGMKRIKGYPIFYNEISFESESVLPYKKIKSNKVRFKTVSPFLVNLQGNNLRYLVPGEDDFNKAFDFNLKTLAKNFLNIDDLEYKLTPVLWKRYPVTHYNQTMSGVKGEFFIEAEPEFLQLIYDIGLGVRRSQGFGMLEIKNI